MIAEFSVGPHFEELLGGLLRGIGATPGPGDEAEGPPTVILPPEDGKPPSTKHQEETERSVVLPVSVGPKFPEETRDSNGKAPQQIQDEQLKEIERSVVLPVSVGPKFPEETRDSNGKAPQQIQDEQRFDGGKKPEIEVAKGKGTVRAEEGLQKFSWLEKKEWSSCSIFKIPQSLRNVHPNAYSPQFISIGPLHRGQPHLLPMEEHKWRFLRRMLARTQHNVDFYIEAISELKYRARQCYAWRTEDDMDDGEFVLMLLLDACFIVELLLAFSQGYLSLGYPRFDPIFAARGITKWIQRDLLLLENQIPLFVVNRLLIAGRPNGAGFSLGTLVVLFFKSAIPGYIENADASLLGIEENLHLLGVIRQCLVPFQWMRRQSLSRQSSVNTTNEGKNPEETINPVADRHSFHRLMPHPVSTLRDSGVRFMKKISSRLTAVEFEGGVLHIPPFVIDDSISIFLNLMALEQCYPHCSDEICLYMIFLDGLIDSPRDVAYLQRRGIIDNQLGSDEAVAQLLNRVGREIVIDDIAGSNLAQLTIQLNQHLQQKWPAWKASLRREYFRHPWSTISVIAAVLVIGLAFIQALYAIIAYHRPR